GGTVPSGGDAPARVGRAGRRRPRGGVSRVAREQVVDRVCAPARRRQQCGAWLVRMNVHPRLSVSGISTWNQSLSEDLALYDELGIHTIGAPLRKLESDDDIQRLRR